MAGGGGGGLCGSAHVFMQPDAALSCSLRSDYLLFRWPAVATALVAAVSSWLGSSEQAEPARMSYSVALRASFMFISQAGRGASAAN